MSFDFRIILALTYIILVVKAEHWQQILALIIILGGLVLYGCVQPSSDSYLKHQHAIILHDDKGHVYTAHHLSRDTWTLLQ